MSQPGERFVVLSTAPDDAVAASLAETVVAERLAACVDVVGGARSSYWWEGRVELASEVVLVAKTSADRVDALIIRLVALHPYDCSEVLALPIATGFPPYLAWLDETLAAPLTGAPEAD
jgi:periplasmic divalent cation tolerance protein